MLYFVFTPLFLLLCFFWLVRGFLFQIHIYRAKWWEKRMKLRPNGSRLQKKPIKPKAEDPRQNPRTKMKQQNAAFGKQRNSRAKDHHGPWWGWHGRAASDARPCVPYCHRLFRFPSRPFIFLRDIFGFCHLKDDVSEHIGNRIPPHSIHHSPCSLVLD